MICSVCRYRHYCKIQIITQISCVNPRPHEYEYSGGDPLFLHQPLIYWSLVTLLNGSLNTNTFKYLSSITFTFSLTKPPTFSLLKVSGQSYIQLAELTCQGWGKSWMGTRKEMIISRAGVGDGGSSPANYRYMMQTRLRHHGTSSAMGRLENVRVYRVPSQGNATKLHGATSHFSFEQITSGGRMLMVNAN